MGLSRNRSSVGDYSIDGLQHKIFLDRKKNTSEFASNIVEERFQKLLDKIINYNYKFLIMEFDLEDIYSYPLNSSMPRWQYKKTRIKPAFLESWISKISIDYGVSVIFAGNAERAEKIAYSILKNIWRKEKNV